ncbi:MAG: phosphotransferase [Rikenellaceae bacterium]
MNSYTKLSENSNDKFIRFSNSEGKAWVVPIRNMRTALNLYQPSGAKGKAVKSLLPYLHWVPQVRALIKAENRQVTLDEPLKKLLCRVLKIEYFEFSIFEGTPSVHQKVTIQISKGSQILAYCKLTESEEVKPLFRHEEQILNQLQSKGIGNIPKCLYCGELSEGSKTLLFVQSTIKTNRSKIIHSWGDEHWKFLEDLHEKTKVKLPFIESDFAKSLAMLEGYLASLPIENKDIIYNAIKQVREYYGGKEVEFSAYHADFTPWNMFFEKGKLFVFDFEYAAMTYPPHLDWFHYYTQTANFERHLTPEQIIAEFKCPERLDSQVGYVAYLLDMISKYVHREKGQLRSNTLDNITFWIDILKSL